MNKELYELLETIARFPFGLIALFSIIFESIPVKIIFISLGGLFVVFQIILLILSFAGGY